MSSTDSTIFADRLKEALSLRELAQSDLAHKTGLQPSAISHFTSGTRRPSFDNLRRIASALQVTTDFLLGRSDDPEAASSTVDELNRHVKKIKNLSDRDRLVEYAQMLASKSEGPEDE